MRVKNSSIIIVDYSSFLTGWSKNDKFTFSRKKYFDIYTYVNQKMVIVFDTFAALTSYMISKYFEIPLSKVMIFYTCGFTVGYSVLTTIFYRKHSSTPPRSIYDPQIPPFSVVFEQNLFLIGEHLMDYWLFLLGARCLKELPRFIDTI